MSVRRYVSHGDTKKLDSTSVCLSTHTIKCKLNVLPHSEICVVHVAQGEDPYRRKSGHGLPNSGRNGCSIEDGVIRPAHIRDDFDFHHDRCKIRKLSQDCVLEI